ncbi:unnamed protein product [Victoria cruziana]
MTTDWGDSSVSETMDGSGWSREQEKAFENALATVPEDSSDRWERIAASVAGKSAVEVKRHYDILVEDVDGIESGLVPLPPYASSSSSDAFGDPSAESGRKNAHFGTVQSSESSLGGKAGSRSDQERRKGIAWTEEEHRLFLLGLEKYGKGDWRSISRNFVISRTPTQVASHAQKYFIRLNSINKDRRRSSIHDITSVSNGDMQAGQGPITGQTNGAVGSTGKPTKGASQLPGGSGVGVYGTPIGQPIGGPLVSAVGTPVSIPSPGHMAYGVRAPVPGAIVPGAPMNLAPMAYPMPQTSAQR